VFATNANAGLKLLQRNVDILIVGYLFSSIEVGYLRYAKSMASMLGTAATPLYTTSYPEFVKLWHRGQITQLRGLFIRLTALSSCAVIGGLLFIIPAVDWLIILTGGADFLGAAATLRWLLVSTGLAICTNFVHPFLLASGRAVTATVAATLATAVQLTTLVILLPYVGISATGIASVIQILVLNLIALPQVASLWNFPRLSPAHPNL
jgi:O-antigen/teichoic acid export membrane protein